MAEAPKKEHPRCLACGKRLRYVRDFHVKFADKGVPKAWLRKSNIERLEQYRWNVAKNTPLEKIADKPINVTADGAPPTHGDYGDNAVCGYKCGYELAIRLLASIGKSEAMSLMPPEWRDVPEPPKPKKTGPRNFVMLQPLEPAVVHEYGTSRSWGWGAREATEAELQAMETAAKALGNGWAGCCKICDTPNLCHKQATCRRTG